MGPQAQRSVRPPRCICRRGKDVRGRKFALGPGAALSDRREFAEPGSGFSKFSASYSLFPSETAPWGRTLRCDWGSYPPVLFKRKFPVPITLPVLSRRHPGEFSESRGKIMRILKSHHKNSANSSYRLIYSTIPWQICNTAFTSPSGFHSIV